MAAYYSYKVADISDASSCVSKIRTWTGDKDNVLAIRYKVGGWTTFSNVVFAGQAETHAVLIAYDPPGDIVRPEPGPSFHTTFDEQPLSSRTEDYQEVAIEFFGDMVMGNAMRKRRYIVEPTADVQAALGGELPGSLEDVAAFICNEPSLLQHVSISQQDWDARDLTPGARKVIAALLEDENSLDQFLASPDTFVEEYSDGTILAEEIGALTLAGGSMEELVREGFNQVELGASTLGDSDAFILIGFERESGRPNAEGLTWFQEQLDAFVELNGFTPGFGWYVTAATLYQQIVVGPGVTEREITYLEAEGHEVIDKTDGSPIDEPLPGRAERPDYEE